jgi:hypothetical protein
MIFGKLSRKAGLYNQVKNLVQSIIYISEYQYSKL